MTVKFLVTGGAGFIGSNVVDQLLAEGHHVRILDDFSTGFRQNIEHLQDKIEVMEGSICRTDDCERAVAGMDKVIHLAAQISVPKSIADPLENNEINIEGTVRLLEAMRKHHVFDIVFASSCAVYGDPDSLPVTELTLADPVSPYAISKLTGEYFLRMYQNVFSMHSVSFRFFNVFGPRQNPTSAYASVIPIFVERLMQNRQPLIFGDGSQTRDFIYVKDIAKTILFAAGHLEKIKDPVFNLCSGQTTTVNELYQNILELVGSNQEPEYKPVRAGDILHSAGSHQRISGVFADNQQVYKPTPLPQALKETVTWYKENIDYHK